MKKLLEISEEDNFELENESTETDSVENELLTNIIGDFQISKHFQSTMYNTGAENTQGIILNSPMQYQEALDRDMQLNRLLFSNFSSSSSREIIRTLDYFYYINGRFLQMITYQKV